jgi:hypothetical protein
VTENRQEGRSSLPTRVLLGALAGAFLGLLELWFYEFDLAHLLAAVTAGAIWGSIVGAAAVLVAPDRFKSALLGGSAGCVAGVVWWAIAQPGTPLALAVCVGAALGTIFILFY